MPVSRRSRSSRTTPQVGIREERGGRKQNKYEEKWNARFKELLDYKSEHGDCNVLDKHGKLGKWVSLQRSAYLANSLGQDRIERLNSIGFKWVLRVLREAAPTVPWETRFDELVQYKAKHDNCNVAKSQGPLGNWVSTQRAAYMTGSLAQDRIDRLNSISFEWSLREAAPWETRFKELVQYKAKHGDCNVPQRQGKLGQWVMHQRTAYSAGSLAQDRIDRLNNIGFKWALRELAPNVPWETRFDELVKYKAKYGDCNVPLSQGQLGTWVSNQRKVYKANSLARDRVDRLNSIGFKWTRRDHCWAQVPWDTRFDELVQYEAKHHNCNVPRSHDHLGRWVNKQRNDCKKNKLSQDRTNRLNGIGFDWTPPIGRSRKRKDLSRTQNKSSSRKKRALLSTNKESLSVGSGAETTDEGRGMTSVSLPAPFNGSHQNLRTESDDEVEEIGALIYDQVMQRRQQKQEKTGSPSLSSNIPERHIDKSKDGNHEVCSRSETILRPDRKALPNFLCASNAAAGYDCETDSDIDMEFVKSEGVPIKTEEMIKYACETDDES